MTYVNHEACGNDPENTRNVSMIRVEGARLIRGRIPREIRSELSAGVAAGKLGHLKKDGLKPEAYFHPNSEWKAKDMRDHEANAGIAALAKVIVCASDLTSEQQQALEARFSGINQHSTRIRISP